MPKFSEREQLLLAVVAGLLLVFSGALLGEFTATDGPRWPRLASTLILTIGGGLVASGMVGFILMLYRSSGDRHRKALLHSLFGTSDPSRHVAIVIPRFPNLEQLERDPNDSISNSERDSPALKDGRLTNKYSLAFDDIAAARHIGTIFAELGLAPPRIEFDDDVLKSVFGPRPDEDKLSHYRYFILIGLYSNEVTMAFASRTAPNHGRRFRLSTKSQARAGLRGVSINTDDQVSALWLEDATAGFDLSIDGDLADRPEVNERKKDFALISTCVAPDGRTCMVVGGGRSRGTRKAASHLRRNWMSVAETFESDAARQGSPREFVARFHLEGPKNSRLKNRGSFPLGVLHD
jgi:hypothetical protein